MPLERSTSKKAFGHNVEAEMHAGKPQKQALAIAYSEKRQAAKKHVTHKRAANNKKDMAIHAY